jgi:hypothetical protein
VIFYNFNFITIGNNGHPGKAGAKGNKGPEGHAVSYMKGKQFSLKNMP